MSVYPGLYNDGKVIVDDNGRISFASMEAVVEYYSLPDAYYKNIMEDDNNEQR